MFITEIILMARIILNIYETNAYLHITLQIKQHDLGS